MVRDNLRNTEPEKDNRRQAKEGLWRAYWSNPNVTTRNALVEAYYGYLGYVASKIKKPSWVEESDLSQAAIPKLIEKIEEYDRNEGIKFETYVHKALKGTMLDELREIDFVPRLVRERTRTTNRFRETTYLSTGTRPSIEESIEEIEIGRKTGRIIKNWVRDSKTRGIYPLTEDIESPAISDTAEVETRDTLDFVSRNLDRYEQLILLLTYVEEGLEPEEIGEVISMRGSTVERTHESILKHLRLNPRLIAALAA